MPAALSCQGISKLAGHRQEAIPDDAIVALDVLLDLIKAHELSAHNGVPHRLAICLLGSQPRPLFRQPDVLRPHGRLAEERFTDVPKIVDRRAPFIRSHGCTPAASSFLFTVR
ncbi:hypothetical protein SAMN05216548_12712 [Faunimonas pinastri]|uniref:Uncharacterized protein n=1 Tax=Faunimonas pinastri TaxID=1855383 RepID=A0A1H9QCS6_9HYPH|nr:hypothetical protein [Faunimonas pinastri]SER58346.1 hypothetical protein SAMN05216548_12712 [Faunimonas pinastri]